jgi:hypothetical protein
LLAEGGFGSLVCIGIIGHLRAWAKRFLIVLIERVSLSFYVIVYGLMVLLFGAIYFWLTPSPNGLAQPGGMDRVITFGGALYFSVITICTVGYGDIVPMGLSRVLACCEALFGIMMVGIILAKVTSARISYHVLRLFGSDAQNRLEGFCSQFERVESEVTRLSPQIADAFQETPGGALPVARTNFLSASAATIGSFHSNSLSFCRYLKEELNEGFFFTDAPVAALTRAGDSVDQVVYVLTQLVIALGPQARIVVLDRVYRRRIIEALDSWRGVCQEIASRSRDEELKRSFSGVAEKCARLADSFFNVPAAPEESAQPDQALGSADEPQA